MTGESSTTTEIISDEDDVIRRLYSGWIKDNGAVSSLAFLDRNNDEPSVNLERLADATAILRQFAEPKLMGFARLNVGNIRRASRNNVEHRPLCDDYSHCVIVTTDNTQGKKSRARELAEISRVIWQTILPATSNPV